MGDGAGWSVLRTTGDPPHVRGGHTATLVEKNLLVLGGVHHKGAGKFEYFTLDPAVLNTETLAWFRPRVAVGKGPPGRAYHTTTRVGTALFVFGGQCSRGGDTSTGLLSDLPVFDLVRMCWETRDVRGTQPRARYWHTAELIEGKLFIIGGFDGTKSLKDVHVLDVETQMWSTPKCTGDPMPGLAQHTATIVGQQLYVFGGMSISQDEDSMSYNKYQQDVMVLDTERMDWKRLRRRGMQPSGRGYHTTNLVGGYLIVIHWGLGRRRGGARRGEHARHRRARLVVHGRGAWPVAALRLRPLGHAHRQQGGGLRRVGRRVAPQRRARPRHGQALTQSRRRPTARVGVYDSQEPLCEA